MNRRCLDFPKGISEEENTPAKSAGFFWGGGFKKVVNPLGREGKHETHPARNGVFYDVALQGRFWGSLGMRNSINHTSQFATDLFYLWNICLKHCEIALENNDSLGGESTSSFQLHPGKLTWNTNMEVWFR